MEFIVYLVKYACHVVDIDLNYLLVLNQFFI